MLATVGPRTSDLLQDGGRRGGASTEVCGRRKYGANRVLSLLGSFFTYAERSESKTG